MQECQPQQRSCVVICGVNLFAPLEFLFYHAYVMFMNFAESGFRVKLRECMIVFVLLCCASVGYVTEDNQDISTLPIYLKIMSGRVSEAVQKTDQTLLFAPKQSFDFDDSKYSSMTNSFALSTESVVQKKSPKSVNTLFASDASDFSTRSTVELVSGNYRASFSDQLLLADLERALSRRGRKGRESVELSALFSQSEESITSIRSIAHDKEEDCVSLLELLPGLEAILTDYDSFSLADLLVD